jgi:hypothetical protein
MKQKKYILALILLLYPLRHVMTGLDLMDAGYALGNYRFFDTMNQTWKLATYLANVVGVLLMHLPFGDTWIGMNVYTGLLIGLTAASAYLFLVKNQPENDKKELLLFMAEIGALSLCWAPSVILYHYLGYILMTIATMVLYSAVTKNNVRYFIAAGVILGLCVAVRMPNITYMAFILPLWYYWFARRKEEGWFGKLINRTLYCICGYAAGVAVPIVYICIRYGLNAYPDMISALFGMTDTATDYKPTSMITAMFGDYISYSVWLFVFAGYAIVGVIIFVALNKIMTKHNTEATGIQKITSVFKMLYLFGLLVVLRFCYGRGMFDFDYREYFSMYKWVTVYLLLVILLCIWALISKKAEEKLKLWSVFGLVTVFITPLGSNNGLYPIINNLFIVAPVSILLIGEFYRKALDAETSAYTAYAIKTVTALVFMCVFIVSLLFGINFVFHDRSDGEGARVSINLKSDSAANGLLTTAAKKEALESLDSFMCENSLTSKQLITYGDIPALSYIFNMKPAIYTTWGDLDSNSYTELCTDLDAITQDYPVIIFGTQSVDSIADETKPVYRKLRAIEEFIEKNNYTQVYENSMYRVYTIQ